MKGNWSKKLEGTTNPERIEEIRLAMRKRALREWEVENAAEMERQRREAAALLAEQKRAAAAA